MGVCLCKERVIVYGRSVGIMSRGRDGCFPFVCVGVCVYVCRGWDVCIYVWVWRGVYLCVCIDMEVECRVIDVHVSVWRDVCVCVCVCVC